MAGGIPTHGTCDASSNYVEVLMQQTAVRDGVVVEGQEHRVKKPCSKSM
jgi:hypothetical protein